MKVWILRGEDEEEALLERIRREFGEEALHWCADHAEIVFRRGLPESLRMQGAVWDARKELRWERVGEGYRWMLISDDERDGEACEVRDTRIELFTLSDRRIHPRQTAYPNGKKTGRLRARLCLRNGIPFLLTLREFVEDEDERET